MSDICTCGKSNCWVTSYFSSSAVTKKSKPKKPSFNGLYDFVYYDEVLTHRLSYDKAPNNIIPEDLID